MVFAIPENLSPETYPMAWLVDTWRGAGLLEYEGVDAAGYLHELRIDNDDHGPYLRLRSATWLSQEPAGAVDREVPGGRMYAALTKGQLWSSFEGYLRVSPNNLRGTEGRFVLEGMIATSAGHAMTWAGFIKGPQFQIVADAIAATPTAASYTGGQIMGGYVESELFYAYDMAAFGVPMRSYMAGRLQRQSDCPEAEPKSAPSEAQPES
ncbi:FABP family protein [Actinotignum sp. GS-2025c]|uniref:FABP family protein n=1 Tax=Actinotignum sp. GS-2025c TaxID=3427276 RepID=UPI003F44BDD4